MRNNGTNGNASPFPLPSPTKKRSKKKIQIELTNHRQSVSPSTTTNTSTSTSTSASNEKTVEDHSSSSISYDGRNKNSPTRVPISAGSIIDFEALGPMENNDGGHTSVLDFGQDIFSQDSTSEPSEGEEVRMIVLE